LSRPTVDYGQNGEPDCETQGVSAEVTTAGTWRRPTPYHALTATMHNMIVLGTVDIAENWTTQLRKGLLELCMLNVIGRGRMYGYDIVRQLRDVDALVVSEGTIYPILSRLKRDGLVRSSLEESPSGPARKYYELTRRGEQLRDDMNTHWELLTRGIATIRERAK
jgi:PadR family transcriptional regulator PadR